MRRVLHALIVVDSGINILVNVCNVIGGNVFLKSVLCLLLYINSLPLNHHDVDRIHQALYSHAFALISKFHTLVNVLGSDKIDCVAKLFFEAVCSDFAFLELEDFNKEPFVEVVLSTQVVLNIKNGQLLILILLHHESLFVFLVHLLHDFEQLVFFVGDEGYFGGQTR